MPVFSYLGSRVSLFSLPSLPLPPPPPQMGSTREDAYLEAHRVSVLTGTIVSQQ